METQDKDVRVMGMEKAEARTVNGNLFTYKDVSEEIGKPMEGYEFSPHWSYHWNRG